MKEVGCQARFRQSLDGQIMRSILAALALGMLAAASAVYLLFAPPPQDSALARSDADRAALRAIFRALARAVWRCRLDLAGIGLLIGFTH